MITQEMLNLAWNFMEYLQSDKDQEDILWLYIGFINNSMAFNIVEYLLTRFGYIN